MRKFSGLLIVGLLLASNVYADGRQIMQQVDDRPDGDDGKAIMNMTLVNHRGAKRERLLETSRIDVGADTKMLMFCKKPADVKGVAFLAWEYDAVGRDDDRWIYMPAMHKVRRISGKAKNDYFMGSDFTYDDMGDRAVDEDRHQLLREESVDGQKCWVVESVPLADDQLYSRYISWIRQDALVPVKVEYYDHQAKLLKVLTVSELRMEQGYWTIFAMQMENVQNQHSTLLTYQDISYDVGLKESLFRVSSLEGGR